MQPLRLAAAGFPFSLFPRAPFSLFSFHRAAATSAATQIGGLFISARDKGQRATSFILPPPASIRRRRASQPAPLKSAALLRGYKIGGRLNGGRKNLCAGRAWSVGRSVVRFAGRRTTRAAPAPLSPSLPPLPSRTPARRETRSPLGRGAEQGLHPAKSVPHGRPAVKGR